MAAEYPIECTIPYDEGSGKEVKHLINCIGEWVRYDPNPKYGGRRIVFLPSHDAQQEALKKNPAGERYFVVPTDVVSDQQRAAIREVVDERLKELGLFPGQAINTLDASPPKKKPGRPPGAAKKE